MLLIINCTLLFLVIYFRKSFAFKSFQGVAAAISFSNITTRIIDKLAYCIGAIWLIYNFGWIGIVVMISLLILVIKFPMHTLYGIYCIPYTMIGKKTNNQESYLITTLFYFLFASFFCGTIYLVLNLFIALSHSVKLDTVPLPILLFSYSIGKGLLARISNEFFKSYQSYLDAQTLLDPSSIVMLSAVLFQTLIFHGSLILINLSIITVEPLQVFIMIFILGMPLIFSVNNYKSSSEFQMLINEQKNIDNIKLEKKNYYDNIVTTFLNEQNIEFENDK